MESNTTMATSDLEPHEEMEFESHEAAYEFYKEYAKSLGFGTAKLSSRRSRASKEFIDAKFSCIRYGNKQQSDDAINPRPSPKIGCKASLHVKRKQDGKWYVYNFVKEHNHELLPEQAHFFRSHRDLDPLKNDVRLRRRKILASVSKRFSAYQNVGCLDNLKRSQHAKGRSLSLEAGDSQMLLDLFMQMQEEDPKFFYAVDLNEENRLRNVFWTWLMAVGGQPPLVLLSGENNALQTAIAELLPDTRHYFSLSWTAEQFDKRWLELVEKFELQDDEWLRSMYGNRIRWVPLFMRGVSFAGLSTRSRSECLNSFFDKYINAESSLRDFLEQYKLLLCDRYEEEAKAEFDAWHEAPDLKSPSPFEKQMSWVYTHEIFKRFQVEVLGAAACHLKKEKEDETGITYTVKDFENNQDFIVEWNESRSEICCLCRMFEHHGYLCRHAIVVLQMSGVFSIPSKYVLQRWTSAALSRHSISGKLDEVQAKVRRYNDLCRRALILAEEGSLSIESYNVAVSSIRDGFQQCDHVNGSLEQDLRPNSCLDYSTNCHEDDNRGIHSRLCDAEPDIRLIETTAVPEIGSGDVNVNNTRERGDSCIFHQDPLDQNIAAVGPEHGFTQVETPNTRPAHLHNMFPVPFNNGMPNMYQGAAPGQFHHGPWQEKHL
uniref:Protein FAR1-RELATED SEQUENCE n=1 Tax=Chenopodium quinoa TaxID=63459 RepID=A0A803N267_CHEQI